MLHVVLFRPEIPQNTGNVARLTAAVGATLHLVKPLGFSLDDRYMKRAGLDYWPEVKLKVHPDWEEFLSSERCDSKRLWFFTTRSALPYFKASFEDGDYLVFGGETKGLPEEIHLSYPDSRLLIPMDNRRVRSLNLSNCAAIGLYEAKRQLSR